MNHRTWFTTWLFLLASFPGIAAGDDGAVPKLTTADHMVLAEKAGWGVVIPLADGSLGMVYNQARPVEEYDAINVCMQWIHSTDGGRTWSEPVLVAERRGSNGKLFTRREDGGYVCYHQRNQSVGQLPSGRIVCAMALVDYYSDSEGKHEPQNHLGSISRFNGIAFTWSDDLGKTWVPARPVPIGPFGGEHVFKPYRCASTQWRIVTLSDGTALMSLYGSLDPKYDGPLEIPEGTGVMAGVIRSTDNGQTWGDVSLIFTKPDPIPWEETTLCLLPGDRLLAHMRTGNHNVVQFVSDDKGRTWRGPTPLTEPRQLPGGAFRLASGRLMATWGNRRAPFGAMAMLSDDNGETWDYDHRVSLAWDQTTTDCGYANGAQAGDGSIVVAYYSMARAGDGMIGLWNGGKVYVVRFTEEQFLKSAGR